MHVCVSMHECMFVRMHTFERVHVCVCVNIHIYLPMYLFFCFPVFYLHIYMYILRHLYMHACARVTFKRMAPALTHPTAHDAASRCKGKCVSLLFETIHYSAGLELSSLSLSLSLSLAGTLSISVRVCVPRAAAPALDTAIETAKIAFAPILVLLGVPSTCVIAFPCDCVCYGTHVTYKYRRM